MTDDLLREACARLLQQLFPSDYTEAISISDVKGRSNIHKKILLKGGQEFGFKCWSAAKPEDGGEEGCAERDSKLNQIAHLVKAPNVCEVRYTRELDCEPFSNRPLAISKWIPSSVSMDKVSEIDLEQIRQSGECYFRKYGEWVALGAAMGFRDWTDNNFVWSHESHALALIDMDWSFNCGKEKASTYKDPIGKIKPIDSQHLDKCISEFSAGVESMQLKLKAQCNLIGQLLAESALEQLREFEPELVDQLKDQASQELKILLG